MFRVVRGTVENTSTHPVPVQELGQSIEVYAADGTYLSTLELGVFEFNLRPVEVLQPDQAAALQGKVLLPSYHGPIQVKTNVDHSTVVATDGCQVEVKVAEDPTAEGSGTDGAAAVNPAVSAATKSAAAEVIRLNDAIRRNLGILSASFPDPPLAADAKAVTPPDSFDPSLSMWVGYYERDPDLEGCRAVLDEARFVRTGLDKAATTANEINSWANASLSLASSTGTLINQLDAARNRLADAISTTGDDRAQVPDLPSNYDLDSMSTSGRETIQSIPGQVAPLRQLANNSRDRWSAMLPPATAAADRVQADANQRGFGSCER